MSVNQINLNNSKRFLLLIPALLFILSAVLVFRWGMGSAIAEQAKTIELVQLSQSWSPHDAQAQIAEANLWLNSRVSGDERKVVEAYERATGLSPYDYRLWLSLGLARERAGDVAGSEKALRQAIALAPFYAHPRWLLGNSLLRQKRFDEAFAELRIAGEAIKILRPQIVSMAWNVYGDVGQASNALGQSSSMKAEFARYLAQQKKLDDALRIWNALNENEKRTESAAANEILVACMQENRLRAVWDLSKILNGDDFPKGTSGEVSNPGFEEDILPAGKSYFGWQIGSGEQPMIAIDTGQGQESTRSLLVSFTSAGGFEFRNVSELVIVEPSARYRLEYFFKTYDLKAVGPLKIEVVDATNNQTLIVSSKNIPDGTNEWQSDKIEFNTSSNTEGIIIRLARTKCSDNNCPIYGKVWYDNFKLIRINN